MSTVCVVAGEAGPGGPARTWASAPLAVVLALTPLLILPGSFFHYDVTPKVAVALMGAAIGLLLWVFVPRLALWEDPVSRWFCVLGAAQVISLLLSVLFSSHAALAWNGGNWRRFGLVSQSALIAFGFLIAASCRETGLRVLLRAATAAGAAAALYGILQYVGVDPFLPAASYHIGEGYLAIVRPPSSMGHADYFAGYLLYVVFFGAALAATESRTVWRALGVFAAGAGSAAIVLSGTRGALVGLGAGAISLWIWKRPRFTRRSALVAAGLCVASLAFYFSPAGLQLRARTQWEMEDLHGGARLWLWRDSLRMARERLLVGFGPETFGLEFPRYQSVELSRAYPDFYHESPHNIFLDALVSQGILGVAILAGFVALAWFAVRHAVAQGQRAAPFLGSALVAGLTAGLFVCFTLPGALYLYATVAMVTKPDLGVRRGRARPPYAVAICLAGAAMFVYFAVRVTVADIALERAKRDLDAGRIGEALRAYQLSQRWHPAGSSDDLYFSRALPSEALARRAVETSEERQNAWYNLAGFYAAQNNAAGVEACLRQSIHASPNWFKPHWALAQMLQLSGRATEAREEAARAVDLDGGKDPEVAKFLQSVHHSQAERNAE